MNQKQRDQILEAAYGRDGANRRSGDPDVARAVDAELRLNALLDQIPDVSAHSNSLDDFRSALDVGEDSVVDFTPVIGRRRFRLLPLEIGLVAAACLVIGLVIFGLPGSSPADQPAPPTADGWTYRLPQSDRSRQMTPAELAALPADDGFFRELIALADCIDKANGKGDENSLAGIAPEDWVEIVNSLEY